MSDGVLRTLLFPTDADRAWLYFLEATGMTNEDFDQPFEHPPLNMAGFPTEAPLPPHFDVSTRPLLVNMRRYQPQGMKDMRAVVVTGPGKVELNYMWLPTFIGMSSHMKQELEARLGPELVGKDLTDEVLDMAHERVLDFILEKFPFPGLRDYLDALKFIREQ